MRTVRFTLRLPPEELHRWYRGEARDIQVVAEGGLRVRLPAVHLRRFIAPDGLAGRFEMSFDEDNKLIALRRLAA